MNGAAAGWVGVMTITGTSVATAGLGVFVASTQDEDDSCAPVPQGASAEIVGEDWLMTLPGILHALSDKTTRQMKMIDMDFEAVFLFIVWSQLFRRGFPAEGPILLQRRILPGKGSLRGFEGLDNG